MVETSQAVSSSEGVQTQTTLVLKQVTESIIVVEYNLLPDTNPGENGNYVALWQNKDQIPWNLPPEKTQSVSGSTQHGTVTFLVDLAQNNYILGYAVGPELASPAQKYGNICSTYFIPEIPAASKLTEDGVVVKAGADDSYFTNLTLGVVSGDSVTVKYGVPANSEPKTNSAWIGVFRGSAGYKITPEKAVPVNSTEDSGWLAINHKFVANKKYTLAYFMSGYNTTSPVQTRMAATLSFTA
jgi:hypothetical protein